MDPVEASRSPLPGSHVDRELRAAGSSWPAPVVLVTTGSTNDDVAALAAAGAPEGTSVVADEQTAGRGRLDRSWTSPVGAGLATSVLVRAGDQPKAQWGLLALAAGLASVDALAGACGVRAGLKWPNDVVVPAPGEDGGTGFRKLAGILCQTVSDDGVVVGIGMNVSLTGGELPAPQATSVLLEGGRPDRAVLLVHLLARLEERVGQWRADATALVGDYRRACVTIGRSVDVSLPDGSTLAGVVTDVDALGHLLVDDGRSVVRVSAGDVVHASL